MPPEPLEGAAAALAATFDPAASPAPPAHQLELLGPPPAGDQAPAPDAGEPGRGPGRPKGSRNRRTEEWTSYVTTRYGSPLEALARVMAAGPDALRAQLGCERVEAFDRWVKVAEALLPCVHQKQATAVAVQQDGAAPVVLQVTEATAARMVASQAGALPSVQIAINQWLSDYGA